MSRIRLLKPDTFLDEDLATVSHSARLLFLALWTLADREGRLEDRPLRIRAQAFPYEAVDVDSLLAELGKPKETGGTFLTRYEVEGVKVIQLTNFAKHQKPHIREAPSCLPTPSPEKPGQNRERQGRAEKRTPVPVSVPDTVPVRTEQPVQPPSSPSVDSRSADGGEVETARADLRQAIAELRARFPAFGEMPTDQGILDRPVFSAPSGPVRLETCNNAGLMRATAGKLRAYGQPKPKRKGDPWGGVDAEADAIASLAVGWVEITWPTDSEPETRADLEGLLDSLKPPPELRGAILTHLLFGRYPRLSREPAPKTPDSPERKPAQTGPTQEMQP